MWPEIVEKYIGKPYQLCGWGDPGYDCFSVLISILRDSGVHIPVESKFENIKLSDYSQFWLNNETKAREVVYRCLIGKYLKHSEVFQQGNVLSLVAKNDFKGLKFLGIYVSNRVIVSLRTYGVKAVSLKYFNVLQSYSLCYHS